MTLEIIVFYLLLFDALIANLLVWFGGESWYIRHFRLMSRYFPLAKGWVSYYLLLVLWMGFMLSRFGAISF